MPMRMILIILLVLAVIAVIPAWPYSIAWSYYPSTILGVILLVIVILALLGHV
jgi:hypothetical protein